MDFIDGGDESLLQVNSALLEGGLGGREDRTKATIKMSPKAPGMNQTRPMSGTWRGCVTRRGVVSWDRTKPNGALRERTPVASRFSDSPNQVWLIYT